jgi:hypothetical protein
MQDLRLAVRSLRAAPVVARCGPLARSGIGANAAIYSCISDSRPGGMSGGYAGPARDYGVCRSASLSDEKRRPLNDERPPTRKRARAQRISTVNCYRGSQRPGRPKCGAYGLSHIQQPHGPVGTI